MGECKLPMGYNDPSKNQPKICYVFCSIPLVKKKSRVGFVIGSSGWERQNKDRELIISTGDGKFLFKSYPTLNLGTPYLVSDQERHRSFLFLKQI
jgi:hypothetical protein